MSLFIGCRELEFEDNEDTYLDEEVSSHESVSVEEDEEEEADFSDAELEDRLKQSKLDLQDLKLAIAYSKGLPKEERKSFFKEFFKYYPLETTSTIANFLVSQKEDEETPR